ncbi:hypothetical protein L7F22_010063 [Adiantum nelumboides]|nr:hypothetical protein [Adiantum nelumboides]
MTNTIMLRQLLQLLLVATLAISSLAAPSSLYPRSDGAKVRGVNLGGWFILERWMTPSLFPQSLVNRGAADQWTWMTAIANDTKAAQMLKTHWSTFITEQDFIDIAAAGLNTVRIPVPHWAFDAVAWEPYLGYAEQPYIAQALLWAQKHSIDVILDLHTAPGSQNGYDSSGEQGTIGFATAPNATQNAQRTISALTKMQDLYVTNTSFGGVVKMLEVLNEPLCANIGQSYVASFYQSAYQALNASVAMGVKVLMHDCFADLQTWESKLADATVWKAETFAMDTHRYHAYAPINQKSYDDHIDYTCTDEFTSSYSFDALVGEFSLSVGCKNSISPADGSCSRNNMNSSVYELSREKDNLFYRRFFEAQTTTYELHTLGWVFWSWKTEASPTWSYQAALAQGWIPSTDPSEKVFEQKKNCPTKKQLSSVAFATTNTSGSSRTLPDVVAAPAIVVSALAVSVLCIF